MFWFALHRGHTSIHDSRVDQRDLIGMQSTVKMVRKILSKKVSQMSQVNMSGCLLIGIRKRRNVVKRTGQRLWSIASCLKVHPAINRCLCKIKVAKDLDLGVRNSD